MKNPNTMLIEAIDAGLIALFVYFVLSYTSKKFKYNNPLLFIFISGVIGYIVFEFSIRQIYPD
jgi:TctA family transporter